MAYPQRKPPAFQFYADDFIGGTVHMSPAEVGIYIRLLVFQWTAGSVPDDPDQCCRICGAKDSEMADAWPVVSAKFETTEPGRMVNRRMEIVRENLDARREAGRRGGEASQAKRKQTTKQTTKQNSSKQPSKTQAKPQANGQAKSKPPFPFPSSPSEREREPQKSESVSESPAPKGAAGVHHSKAKMTAHVKQCFREHSYQYDFDGLKAALGPKLTEACRSVGFAAIADGKPWQSAVWEAMQGAA